MNSLLKLLLLHPVGFCIVVFSVSLASRYFFFFFFFRAAPVTYRSSQARGQIGTVAAGLHHSHSNVGSEPCLLTALPAP